MREEYKILLCDTRVVISFLVLVLSIFGFDSNKPIYFMLIPIIIIMVFTYFLFINIDNYELRDIDKWNNFLIEEQYKFCLTSIIKWNEILLKVTMFFLTSIFTATYFLMEEPSKINIVDIFNFFESNENRDFVFFIIIYFIATFMLVVVYQMALKIKTRKIEIRFKSC